MQSNIHTIFINMSAEMCRRYRENIKLLLGHQKTHTVGINEMPSDPDERVWRPASDPQVYRGLEGPVACGTDVPVCL